VKPFTGKASVVWNGGPQQRRGAINGGGVLSQLPYGFGQQARRNATHPSELIAAAHAGSFSMTLAEELGAAGYPVHRIDTTAIVTVEHIAARWTMSRVHLEVIATVREGEQFDFVDATLRAKANCPVSRLMNANISMQARLKRGVVAARLPAREAATARIKKPQGAKGPGPVERVEKGTRRPHQRGLTS
jgi:osmotically inducible protein OsmC